MTTKTQNKYPELTFDNVFAVYNIGQNMRRIPNYLEDSPYPEMIKKTIKLIYAQQQEEQEKNNKLRAIEEAKINFSELDVSAETQYLFRETKALLNSNVLDDKDKATIIKTATSQIEKLVNLIERSENINRVRDFETKVLKVLKKVLPEKRNEFVKELQELEAKESTDVNNDRR